MINFSITLPIYWKQTQTKTVLVSMNQYRNWHYHTSNKFKKEFAELVVQQLHGVSAIEGQYRLSMRVFYKTANSDASNIVALIEKVLLDALCANGLLVNDTVKYHISTEWVVVQQDKLHPRCEVLIEQII